MKHIVIGDIHGRDAWQDINISAYQKIVFIGDYVDSLTLSDDHILDNLKNIVSLKKVHPDKVVLLLGNHDAQYLHFPNYRSKRYRPSMQNVLTLFFRSNSAYFQIAYQRKEYLFTHAGITNSWYDEFIQLPLLEKIRDSNDTLADLLNKIEYTSARDLLHHPGKIRGGHGNGGPLWADYLETSADMLQNFHQVVGHTQVPDIQTITQPNSSVTYIDVLGTQTKFYEIDL